MQQLRSKRRKNPEVWHKANRMMIALIIAGFVAVAVAAFYPEIVRHRSLAKQLAEEKNLLADQQLTKARREREVHLLKTDSEYVEIIARDRIGVMKEGETIYRLDSPATATPKTGTN
ncbi:MAG: FtsB family cell division protein [Spartobacteria bacterium]